MARLILLFAPKFQFIQKFLNQKNLEVLEQIRLQIDLKTYPNDAGGLVVDLIDHNLEKMANGDRI